MASPSRSLVLNEMIISVSTIAIFLVCTVREPDLWLQHRVVIVTVDERGQKERKKKTLPQLRSLTIADNSLVNVESFNSSLVV